MTAAVKRRASVLPQSALLELFDSFCMFHALPPHDGLNPCAGDGHFWRSIEKKLAALGVSVKDAEVESYFDAYRAACRNHHRETLKQHAAILRRLRARRRL